MRPELKKIVQKGNLREIAKFLLLDGWDGTQIDLSLPSEPKGSRLFYLDQDYPDGELYPVMDRRF